ncbi:hypothetical protein [Streptomyces sp. NPDC050534]|uniref:hypothetical protein n=1 Tax=Streptomyces sp. NPDC050534 TaxID=3365625 RepID=UPI0037A0A9C7
MRRAGLRARARAVAAAATLTLLALGSGQASAHTAQPQPSSPPHYTALDLGTLGGTSSSAIAVDRDTVVGSSALADGFLRHAFAYDRSTHVMTDLGTLGGNTSSAVAVQGRHVIGDSTTADGDEHAFVYDLRTHHMRALGTFGGTGSHVDAISGDTVVGSARTAGNQSTHAFAYNVRTGTMTDLGSPAGPAGISSAVGISEGRYVAGTWDVPSAPFDGGQSFVYDLRTHTMTDLCVGGVHSKATSMSGHTIVGTTQPKPSGSGDTPAPRGFAYDIRTGTVTDLGPEMSYGPVVTGHTVVASATPAAYALDLVTGARTTFGTGPGRTGINGAAGKFVVGDGFPGPFSYVYRVDTHRFTLLPAAGGVHGTATGADRGGAVVGTSATAPTDPSTPDGSYHATLWSLRKS